MGQAASRSDHAPSPPPRRRRERLSTLFQSQPYLGHAESSSTPHQMLPRRRSSLMDYFSRFQDDSNINASHSSLHLRMHRPRLSRLSDSVSRRMSLRRRENPVSRSSTRASQPLSSDSADPFYTDDPQYLLPSVDVPDLSFDLEDFPPADGDLGGRSPNRRSNLRPVSSFSDRFSSLRPDRGLRNMTSSLRRRRSPLLRDDDQAAILSRLLSVAAAATAATLMGGDQRAVSEARSISGDGEDGTFEGFLRALQSGRIAAALRQSGIENSNDVDADGNPVTPLNFFRMFRFGPTPTPGQHEDTHDSASRPSSNSGVLSGTTGAEDGAEGRMVPIIIVGIRSLNPDTREDSNMPPFLDALSSFPNSFPAPDVTIDGLMTQPQHGTRITHRRRASMGGLGAFPSNYDSPRQHRIPDRPRPLSTPLDTPSGPRPPPSTPASAGLSAFPSGATTPTTTHIPSPSLTPPVEMTSRRSSLAPRAAFSGLDAPVEESPMQRSARQRRRLSESDSSRFGSGSSRRNGVVAPDAPTDSGSEASRSWIIYVLGGSYPENHPIVTTPSLFTDSPTHEDMLLLQSLLGPAKPPVASEDDVASAPGLLTVVRTKGSLLAVPVEDDDDTDGASMTLTPEQQCRVCLCEFEAGDEARKLVKCGHLFHKLCIDKWLTTGRNSCPLCRAQGVDEKSSEAETPVGSDDSSGPTIPATPTEAD